jgi:hypothetical protein
MKTYKCMQLLWRWMRHVPPKFWQPPTTSHGVRTEAATNTSKMFPLWLGSLETQSDGRTSPAAAGRSLLRRLTLKTRSSPATAPPHFSNEKRAGAQRIVTLEATLLRTAFRNVAAMRPRDIKYHVILGFVGPTTSPEEETNPTTARVYTLTLIQEYKILKDKLTCTVAIILQPD